MTLFHASCVALDGAAVLIRGPSGSGKSSLALRLMDAGATLVADDQCEVSVETGVLMARAPANLRGRIEVRGLGIIKLLETAPAPLGLVIDLCDADDIERLPTVTETEIEGVTKPWMQLDASKPDAPARVRTALKAFRDGSLEPPDGHQGS